MNIQVDRVTIHVTFSEISHAHGYCMANFSLTTKYREVPNFTDCEE